MSGGHAIRCIHRWSPLNYSSYLTQSNNGGNFDYVFYVDLFEHAALWREVTKDFPRSVDWNPLLQEAYKKDPTLQKKLSKKSRYGVPESLLNIQCRQSGSQGELCLHYQRADITFVPVSDGERYQWGSAVKDFREEYLRECRALYVRGEFVKGNAETFKNCSLTIKP